jgi:hypothetical protein
MNGSPAHAGELGNLLTTVQQFIIGNDLMIGGNITGGNFGTVHGINGLMLLANFLPPNISLHPSFCVTIIGFLNSCNRGTAIGVLLISMLSSKGT